MNAEKILDSAWEVISHFTCTSVRRTVRFYTEDLHFNLGGVDPENATEPNMCSVFIGIGAMKGNIYLFKVNEVEHLRPATAMIALVTEAVDQYHDLLKQEGRVTIIEPIADQPWGYRQFAIQDLDGNKIQFFRFLKGGNPGDGSD